MRSKNSVLDTDLELSSLSNSELHQLEYRCKTIARMREDTTISSEQVGSSFITATITKIVGLIYGSVWNRELDIIFVSLDEADKRIEEMQKAIEISKSETRELLNQLQESI
jgi:hypothetical protein